MVDAGVDGPARKMQVARIVDGGLACTVEPCEDALAVDRCSGGAAAAVVEVEVRLLSHSPVVDCRKVDWGHRRS